MITRTVCHVTKKSLFQLATTAFLSCVRKTTSTLSMLSVGNHGSAPAWSLTVPTVSYETSIWWAFAHTHRSCHADSECIWATKGGHSRVTERRTSCLRHEDESFLTFFLRLLVNTPWLISPLSALILKNTQVIKQLVCLVHWFNLWPIQCLVNVVFFLGLLCCKCNMNCFTKMKMMKSKCEQTFLRPRNKLFFSCVLLNASLW